MAFAEKKMTTGTQRVRGFVSKKDEERGFGFIRTDAHRQYFFHFRDLKGVRFADLEPNTMVDFDPVDMASQRAQAHSKKPVHDRAANVSVVAAQQRAA